MSVESERQLTELRNEGIGSRFMAQFDPSKSRREQRKAKKALKYSSGVRKRAVDVFDSKGIHINSGEDLCDCLERRCTGCFVQCPNKKCGSRKCGPDCRQKRKYYYHSIEDQIQKTKRFNDIGIGFDPNLQSVQFYSDSDHFIQ